MALTTDNTELATAFQQLADLTGEPKEVSVFAAVQEKLERERLRKRKAIDWKAIREIQDRVARMPVLDTRSEDEVLGYNEHGFFD